MRSSNVVKSMTVLLGSVLLAGSVGLAEDTKGKWQFGVGLSYMSTSDSIRSNADVAIANEELGNAGLPAVVFVDPRPDDNVLNEPSIQDDFKFDLSASYGLTRWLALEVWGSYMKAPVGNIEVFIENQTTFPGDGVDANVLKCGPGGKSRCFNYSSGSSLLIRDNTFVPVGELTQIPIHLSALFRFRPESPFDPYLGAGVGYIFTNLETSPEFQSISQQLTEREIKRVCGGDISYCGGDIPAATLVPDADLDTVFQPSALTVEVEDAFEWHLAAGIDYYMNERFSIYVDARYSWANGQVDIKASDFHQVSVQAIDQGRLFLATQSVWDQAVNVSPGDPLFGKPYFWEDQGPLANASFHGRCPGCVGSGFFETEDKNGNGLYEASEDNGVLYILPPGSFDPNERIGELAPTDPGGCPACVLSGPGPVYPGQVGIFQNSDTEDVNFTKSLDRFLQFGFDICTTPQGLGHPACADAKVAPTDPQRFTRPTGCGTIAPAVGSTAREGCPAPFTGVKDNSVDDIQDAYTVQGGEIRYDGFSLGVGIKLTF